MTESVCEYCETQDKCEEERECYECCESHDQPCHCDGCVELRVEHAESERDAYD